jgi:hypothetical protein
VASLERFEERTRVRRCSARVTLGKSLSPLIDRGQIEGGFLQVVGRLTTEELVWSEAGALATSGASTYKLPTLAECPEIFNVALLHDAREPGVVGGSKRSASRRWCSRSAFARRFARRSPPSRRTATASNSRARHPGSGVLGDRSSPSPAPG